MNEQLLAKRIKEMRQSRGMTLEQVGKIAGLSKSLLSKVENCQVSPPISTLSRIASALSVPIGYFFEEELRQHLAVFVRREDRQRVSSNRHGPDYSYEHLAHGSLMPRLMEPFVITLDDDVQAEPTLYDHPGEEFILVLEGEMEYMLGSEVYHMTVGDSMYLDARVPHGPKQISGKKVVYLAIFTNR